MRNMACHGLISILWSFHDALFRILFKYLLTPTSSTKPSIWRCSWSVYFHRLWYVGVSVINLISNRWRYRQYNATNVSYFKSPYMIVALCVYQSYVVKLPSKLEAAYKRIYLPVQLRNRILGDNSKGSRRPNTISVKCDTLLSAIVWRPINMAYYYG